MRPNVYQITKLSDRLQQDNEQSISTRIDDKIKNTPKRKAEQVN